MVLEVMIGIILDGVREGASRILLILCFLISMLVTQVCLPCENSPSCTPKFLHFPISMLYFDKIYQKGKKGKRKRNARAFPAIPILGSNLVVIFACGQTMNGHDVLANWK